MHMQKNLTLKVDEELVEKAHRYGINISKFLEFALDDAFKHGLENLSYNRKNTEWTGRDLNPRPLACEASDLPLIYRPEVADYRIIFVDFSFNFLSSSSYEE